MTDKTIDAGNWVLEIVGEHQNTKYALRRKSELQLGIFNYAGTFDFMYRQDADRMIELLTALELLTESNFAEAIQDSKLLRKANYQAPLPGAVG